MPTVPMEQNRTGIADVTDAKLQPGDYSGTGLQALGAGMQQLGGVGAKIAGDVQQRQDSDDAFEIKKAWNAYAEGARSIRADAIGKFDADPPGMLQRMTQDYGGLRDWIRSRMKNDRQRGQFDQVIAERFDYDLSGALTESERALQRGQDQQSLLLEQNAADDAVDNADDPALFDRHLHTGAESIAGRAAARGDDPAAIEQSVTAYRSGIQRRALQNVIDRDPVAAANRYRTIRDGMTAADQQTARKELFEPLARALGARDVDGLLPPPEMEGPAPLSPEQRASVAEAIEAQPWTDARKRYAREDLATRGSLEDRQRKQAADAAKDKGLAIAEQLGPDFTSITQLPPEIRRDLDDDTMQTLGLQAQDNLDGRQVAPNGEASLMMNLIASQNPAAFAKEDLRLVRGKVTPEEYDRFDRIKRGLDSGMPGGTAMQRRIFDTVGGRDFVPGSSPPPSLYPASYTPSQNQAEGDSQTIVAPTTVDETVARGEIAVPVPGKRNRKSRKNRPMKNLFPAPSGPSTVLSGFVTHDPALLALLADNKRLNLPTLERTYEHGMQAVAGSERKLNQAILDRKDETRLEKIRQDIAAKKLRAEAAARALLPATMSQHTLETYFVGKGVNIILGAPVDDHGQTVFDGQGRIRPAKSAARSTYVILGPDHKFLNPDDAAFDAIALARASMGALGDGREKTGYVIQRADGTFGYGYSYPLAGTNKSTPRTSSSGVELEAAIDWPPPEGAIAMWHIHPVGGQGDNDKNRYFGQGDVKAPAKAAGEIARRLKTPLPPFDAYLGGSDGAVRAVRGITPDQVNIDGTTVPKDAYKLIGPGFFRLR